MKANDILDKIAKLGSTIDLYQPTSEQMDEWKGFFSAYTMPVLHNMAERFRKLFSHRRISIDGSEARRKELPKPLANYLDKRYGFLKSDLVNFLCFIMGDMRNFMKYIDALDPKERMVWQTVLTKGYVSDDQVKAITGKSWFLRTNYHTSNGFAPEAAWLERVSGRGHARVYWDPLYYYTLNPKLAQRLMPVFFPSECSASGKLLTQLPQDEIASLHIFSHEATIMAYWSMLDGLYMSHKLEQPRTKIPINTLQRLSKMVAMEEFFPECADKALSLLRTSIVLNIYVQMRLYIKTLPTDGAEAIKKVLQTALQHQHVMVPLLLSHITGLRTYAINNSHSGELLADVEQVVATLQVGKWMSAAGLHMHLMTHCTRHMKMFGLDDFDKLKLENRWLYSDVYLNNVVDDLSLPYVNGLLYTFAAFGLLDVAYRDVSPADRSPLHSLAYFRLTPLGAYYWGHTNDYQSSAAQVPQKLFDLDEQRLIVRAMGDNNPYEPFLADLAVPIGNHRYRLTMASLMGSSSNADELQARINLFKRYICSEPPQLWDDFFHTLQQRVGRIAKLDGKRYAVYQLSSTDRHLHGIVATDPLIRQHTVRAEGYLLLVETHAQTLVLDKLREYGYLL